jgi:hypothetical protein
MNSLRCLSRLACAALFAIFCGSLPAAAEDINEVFKKVNEYVQQKNYPKAMEELQWAQKELEKLNQQRLSDLLPKTIEGFVGEETEVQSAMGFTSIERQYNKGDQGIHLSITGAGSAGGGLAGLAKMGMMMEGSQSGKDQFRVDGRTASLETSGAPELTVFLESGSMLQLRSSDESVDSATLKKFAQGLKIGELDDYLKGSKG